MWHLLICVYIFTRGIVIILHFSVILPLPQNVIDYLLDDGTLVVSGRYVATHTRTRTRTRTRTHYGDVFWFFVSYSFCVHELKWKYHIRVHLHLRSSPFRWPHFRRHWILICFFPLRFSDHNTLQTHTYNSDSNAEEDIQVQALFITNPVCSQFTVTKEFSFPQKSARPLLEIRH